MSAALPLIDVSAGRGGSGRGISYYTTGASCARKIRLDKQTEHLADPGRSARVGILAHALLDIFYSGELAAQHVGVTQVSDVAWNEDMQEAQRLVGDYLRTFPEVDFWGEVIGTEYQLPATDEDAHCVRDFFGVELTARLDLVTRVSLHHADRIRARTGLILAPGVYIIDHKTRSRRESDISEIFGLSAQFKAYPKMWDLLNSAEDTCMGMIPNVIIGTKAVTFQHTVISPPTKQDLAGLKQWLQYTAALIDADMPNWSACRSGYGTCAHYKSGLCGRI